MLAISLGSVATPTSGSSQSFAPASPRPSDDAVRLAPVVERARQGDAEAFGRLYDHYHASVYRVIYAQTRSTPLTEDLTSDTFFRALRGMPNFKLDAELFAPWLYRIARNLVIDHFKSSRARFEQVDDMSRHDDVTDGADTLFMAEAKRERVRAAIAELPDNQRRVVTMRFLGELAISEVADLLDLSEGAVKQLQFRGLRNLARLLDEMA